MFQKIYFFALLDFLMNNRKEFITQADIVPYSTGVAIGLMKSGLSPREKAAIIPHLDNDILNEDLSDEVIKLMNVKEVKITDDSLLAVMALSKMTNEKISILISKLNKREIKEDTITSILNTLPEPYKAIAAKRKKPEIPKNDRTKQLVNLLKDIGYISSYSETGKGIRVNTRLK